MSILIVILLGIVQGVTEFLPISSSGHLVLLEKIFHIKDNVILLNVFLHVGSLIAVLIYYRKEVWALIKKPFQQKTLLLFLASLPTIIIVLIFKNFIEDSFNGEYLVFGFLVTAFFLIVASVPIKTSGKVDKKTALIMSFVQGFATLPGISRSGSTITAGLLLGKDKKEVADFSFLMSIPIILASFAYELIGLDIAAAAAIPWYSILVGVLFSFVFGYIAIAIMIKMIKKAKLYYFSIYLIILSIILLVFNI